MEGGPWAELRNNWLIEDSLRADGVDGDADNGDVLPSGIMDDRPPRRTAGPDVTLAGDGSPLVAE